MCFYEPSYQLFVSVEKKILPILVFEWRHELPLCIFDYPAVGNKSLN